MNTIATAATILMNGSMLISSLAATVRISVSTSTGTSPVQNFDQRKSLSLMGAVRMIQNAAPSTDTAGNTKRAATVAITNPAIPRFTKA